MKARFQSADMNLDSLLDTVTNVVGILVLVFVLVTLNMQKTVERIREEDPSQFGVTEQMLTEMQQQAIQQHEDLKELQVRTFGLDVQVQQDQATLEQQRQLLQDLPNVPEVEPVDLQKLKQQVEQRKRQQEQLQEELAKLDREIADVEGELGETPEMSAPPPQIVRLPNPRPAPKDAREIRFICREGRILVFDPEQLRDRVKKRVEYLLRPMLAKAGADGEIDCQRLVDAYNKEAVGDQEFRGRLVIENFNLVLIYEHRGVGETSDRLRLPSSRFQAAVRRMSTDKNYARFLVWPDSFDVYVNARAVCDERGVLAGWEPYTEDYEWKMPLGVKVQCQGKPKPKPVAPTPPSSEKPKPPPPPLPSDTID